LKTAIIDVFHASQTPQVSRNPNSFLSPWRTERQAGGDASSSTATIAIGANRRLGREKGKQKFARDRESVFVVKMAATHVAKDSHHSKTFSKKTISSLKSWKHIYIGCMTPFRKKRHCAKYYSWAITPHHVHPTWGTLQRRGSVTPNARPSARSVTE